VYAMYPYLCLYVCLCVFTFMCTKICVCVPAEVGERDLHVVWDVSNRI